jgi:ABC-type transporter Mla subunit MlaD
VPPPPPSSRPPVAAPDLAALGGAAGAPAGTPEGAVARTFVDAFDRLSERLLERLRTIRQDVDTDLQAVRTELNQLRQSFEDASQSVQLRQLHASLEEVRGDVEGLRRVVLEWPELDRLSDDVAAMRGDLSLLFDPARDSGDHAPSAVLGELESTVERLAAGVGRIEEAGGARELSWLVDEVAAVRTDVHKLLKRVRPTVRLDPEQIDLIADAVAARLRDEPDAGGRRSRRK